MDELLNLEEKIEQYYICLAELEKQGESEQYQMYLEYLKQEVKKEKRLLEQLDNNDIIALRNKILRDCQGRESSLALGHMTNAGSWRLLYILNLLFGSYFFSYEVSLRYDLNQIALAFLDELILNEYYFDIREDLIYYKYNLFFKNEYSEYDFLESVEGMPSIESKSYKTNDTWDLIFVDKTVLLLEGRELIQFLVSLKDGFSDDANQYALAVIAIIELFGRLILSEEDILLFLEDDFNNLIKGEDVSLELKDLIKDMLQILDKFKNKITIVK